MESIDKRDDVVQSEMFEAPKDTKISLTSTIEDTNNSPANPFNQATKKIINFHPASQNDIYPAKNANSYEKPVPTSEIRGLSTISASNDDDDTDL